MIGWSVNAQTITSNPSQIFADGTVTITFQATSTSNPLYNYPGDVYMYTGVNTNNGNWQYVIQSSWLDNNPKCKMTKSGTNAWSLTMPDGPRDFYGISENDQLKAIALVIRDEFGNKGTPNDVFLPLSDPGLYLSMTPSSDQIIMKGSTLNFSLSASETCSQMRFTLNSEEIKKLTNISSITYSSLFNIAGEYVFVGEATSSTYGVKSKSIKITVTEIPLNQSRPAGTGAGINIIDDHTVTLCLYAPDKQFIHLTGDFNDWKISNDYLMKKDGDYWWITLSGLESGKEYAYQYFVDGKLKIADPYTDKILDPWNDQYIPSSVYPDLKPYPAGKTEGIVSVFRTGQIPYNWQVSNFQSPSKEKLVIYEMLIRDFIEEHSFNAALSKLDYLKRLGINAIELMPVNEFEGNDSWGYNPSFYFAVDKYYGTKNDFKTFIDACHQRGIAVIMDMVLNHSYGQSPFVQLYWDTANNRPAVNNPWYNVTSPNTAYSWGYDFNHESAQTQALVDSINSYWMNEYKVDGFRFDFTKGFTQKTGDGWAYDASRIAILKRMTSEIYKRKANAIVIFEHLTENTEEIELSDAGIMLWGNINNNYCEGIMGYTESSKSDLSWGIYKERGFTQPNLVAYMESHDEERMMYKAKTYGNSLSGYDVKNPVTGLNRAGLSACFYLPTPGPKMIWQFGELGYDYSINTCSNETVNDDGSCRLASKPIRWDYYSEPDRQALYDIYYQLNYLKQNEPVFSTADFSYSLRDASKYFVWRSPDMNAFAIGNFDVKAGTVSFTLPRTGAWYEVFTGTTINVASTTYSVTLQPGEYHLYTDKQVQLPSGTDKVQINKSSLVVYPNPVKDVLYLETSDKIDGIGIFSSQGQCLLQTKETVQINVSALPQGMYLLKVTTDDKVEMIKFLKK